MGSGTIASITLDAVLTNISGTGAKVLEQEFLIDFISDSQPAESLASNNNHNASSRSGNPGYITGRPVLAGECVKQQKVQMLSRSVDKYAIGKYSGGLRFPLVINGDGTYESISDKAKEFGSQVLYGIDARSVALRRTPRRNCKRCAIRKACKTNLTCPTARCALVFWQC